MERYRYIQWTVSAKDAALPDDLGYRMRIAEDRDFSRLLIDDASLGGMQGSYFFKDDGGNFVPAGTIPKTEGLAVRYQLSPAVLTHHTVAGSGSVLYRLNWHNHVIEARELAAGLIAYVSVNQANGDVWVTSDLGAVFTLSLPWATSSFAQVSNHSRLALAVEVDGARQRYWHVQSDHIYLTGFDGTDIVDVATTYNAESVVKAYISPHTGDLFVGLKANAAPNGGFLMHVKSDGTVGVYDNYILDLSPWETNGILFVDGGNEVFKYENGSATSLFSTSPTINSTGYIHGNSQDAVYVADYNTGLLARFTTAGVLNWSTNLGMPAPYIWADFDLAVGDPVGRRSIKFWANDRVGSVSEEYSSQSIISTVNMTGGATKGAVLSALRPQHVWSKLETITQPVVIYPQSSSSTSSQSSGDISTSSWFSNTSSGSSSSTEVDYLATKNSALWNYWSLDQSATPWTDVIHGNNMARNSGTIQSVNVKHNKGIQCASNGGLIYASGVFKPTNGFAVSFWQANPSVNGASLYNGNNQGFILQSGRFPTWSSTVNSVRFNVWQSNNLAVEVHGLQPVGLFHTVAIAADGKVELYLNGVLVDTKTFNNTFSPFALMIANGGSGTLWQIDELAYWKDITFSTTANRNKFVAALYNNGQGRFYSGGNWT